MLYFICKLKTVKNVTCLQKQNVCGEIRFMEITQIETMATIPLSLRMAISIQKKPIEIYAHGNDENYH